MKYPEIQDQIARYEGFGFTKAYCNDMDKLYSWFITDADRKRIERIEYFDEYEEWHLIQGHYCILVAAQGNTVSGLIIGLQKLCLFVQEQLESSFHMIIQSTFIL